MCACARVCACVRVCVCVCTRARLCTVACAFGGYCIGLPSVLVTFILCSPERKGMDRIVGECRGGAQPRTPAHGLFFFASLQGCWGAGRSRFCAAWKVCAGVSVPIYLKPVYSTMPGALVNGVYQAPLFFVHLANVTAAHTTPGSHSSGRNRLRLETRGHVTALFLLTSFRHRPLPPLRLVTQ